MTYGELLKGNSDRAKILKALGVKAGDRITKPAPHAWTHPKRQRQDDCYERMARNQSGRYLPGEAWE